MVMLKVWFGLAGEVDEPGKATAAGDVFCDGARLGRPVPQQGAQGLPF